jgi:hypothetical protein
MKIELKAEVEARLVAEAQAKGIAPPVYAASVIERAFAPNGERRAPRSPEVVRVWLNSLSQFSDKIPQLSEEAFTRASFYEDRE